MPRLSSCLFTPRNTSHVRDNNFSQFTSTQTYPSFPFPWLTGLAGFLTDLGRGLKMEKLGIVQAGDPILYEPARHVDPLLIGSCDMQETVDRMIKTMRKANVCSLSAPQIGVPLQIIVLETTQEIVNRIPKQEAIALNCQAFDLMVIFNPKLEKKSKKTAFVFEGCCSVDGFVGDVERHLEVEVTGLDRHGQPIKVDAHGWKAHILQHECDHLDGTLYVEKMVPRSFRTINNFLSPLPSGCPKLGASS